MYWWEAADRVGSPRLVGWPPQLGGLAVGEIATMEDFLREPR